MTTGMRGRRGNPGGTRRRWSKRMPQSHLRTASLTKQANKYVQHPTNSRWFWGVRLHQHNVGAPSWRSMTTGMRGRRGNPGGTRRRWSKRMPQIHLRTASLTKQANKYVQHPTNSRWFWGVRLHQHNVGAPSWRSMTTGMRGRRGNPGGTRRRWSKRMPQIHLRTA